MDVHSAILSQVRLLLVQFSEASSSPVSEVHSVVSSTLWPALYWDPLKMPGAWLPSATFSWPRGKLRKCRLLLMIALSPRPLSL